MSKQICHIQLDDTEQSCLKKIINKRTSPQQMVLRARIILMTSQGCSVDEIMDKLETTKMTISKWKKRFLEKGLDGLTDLARSGRSTIYSPEIRHKIAAEACNPPEGRTHWTIRDLADHMNLDRGISHTSEGVRKEMADEFGQDFIFPAYRLYPGLRIPQMRHALPR